MGSSIREADFRKQFGALLRSRRAQSGLTQEQLAERAGLHRTYVADIERGVRNPSLTTIARLADGLNTALSSFFPAALGQALAVEDRYSPRPEEAAAGVLLVEDDPNDAALTLRAFQRARFANRIHVVSSGEEALEFVFATGAYAHRPPAPLPSVILLDLRLPGIDGLEVLRRLKGEPRTRHIPVAVLTGSKHDRDVAESKRLGAETYILKPVDFRRFSEAAPQLHFSWAMLPSPASRVT